MVWLSVILAECELEPDEPMEDTFCNNCNLCVTHCPVHALDAIEMKQTACWDYAFGGEDGGEWKIKCHKCRDICPYCLGSLNMNMKRKYI
jgi:epoxyqueuosine reductase QueG